MEDLLVPKACKYCLQLLEPCINEGLTCQLCNQHVHAVCIKRGSVPGGLAGDLFFAYTCQECSVTGSEQFVRQNISW